MLKKAKTGKVGTRIMAWFMTLAMMLSLIGVVQEPIWASENTIALDGAEVVWDLTSAECDVYTGSNSVVTSVGLEYRGDNHGANVATGSKVSINVPAGKITITVGACQYGSASGTLQVNGVPVSETKSLGGAASDGVDVVFEYTTAEATTIDLVFEGDGFIHYIKASAENANKEVVTIPGNKLLS